MVKVWTGTRLRVTWNRTSRMAHTFRFCAHREKFLRYGFARFFSSEKEADEFSKEFIGLAEPDSVIKITEE